MSVDLASVQTGMDVLDPTGDKIGTIGDILNVQAYSETDTTSSYAGQTPADLGVTRVTPNPAGGQPYLKVDQGGVLGIGAKELYIPFSSVQNVAPGDNVTVDCTKDTCDKMYGAKPEFLR